MQVLTKENKVKLKETAIFEGALLYIEGDYGGTILHCTYRDQDELDTMLSKIDESILVLKTMDPKITSGIKEIKVCWVLVCPVEKAYMSDAMLGLKTVE